MINIVEIFRNILKGGIRIGWSTGKPFDPHYQVRSDAMDDIAKGIEKRKSERRKKNGDKRNT